MTRRRWIATAVVGALAAGGLIATVALAGDDAPVTPTPTVASSPAPTPEPDAARAAACRVDYAIRDEWPGGFTVDVTVHNLADPLDGWTLAWRFTGDERVENLWEAQLDEAASSGPDVVVRNVAHNAALGASDWVTFGFTGTGVPGLPTDFRTQ